MQKAIPQGKGFAADARQMLSEFHCRNGAFRFLIQLRMRHAGKTKLARNKIAEEPAAKNVPGVHNTL